MNKWKTILDSLNEYYSKEKGNFKSLKEKLWT